MPSDAYKCWCCGGVLGHCCCQDENTEICIGCNCCEEHCRCIIRMPEPQPTPEVAA